jgi:hypothetical protein
MSPVGLRTKNHCAGEGQQQIVSQAVAAGCFSRKSQIYEYEISKHLPCRVHSICESYLLYALLGYALSGLLNQWDIT